MVQSSLQAMVSMEQLQHKPITSGMWNCFTTAIGASVANCIGDSSFPVSNFSSWTLWSWTTKGFDILQSSQHEWDFATNLLEWVWYVPNGRPERSPDWWSCSKAIDRPLNFKGPACCVAWQSMLRPTSPPADCRKHQGRWPHCEDVTVDWKLSSEVCQTSWKNHHAWSATTVSDFCWWWWASD